MRTLQIFKNWAVWGHHDFLEVEDLNAPLVNLVKHEKRILLSRSVERGPELLNPVHTGVRRPIKTESVDEAPHLSGL